MEKINAIYEKTGFNNSTKINLFRFRFSEEQVRVRQRHWHRSIEIGYHENADGSVFIDGTEHKIKGNALILINSKCVHEIHNHVTAQSSSTVLIIPYDILRTEIPGFDDMYFTVDSDDETVIRIIKEMSELYYSDSCYNQLMLKSLQYELLYYLCRHCCSNRSGMPSLSVRSKKDWVQEVSQYLNENYLQITGITDLSDYFGYTREAFCRKFRQFFHCTIHRYLVKLRLLQAISQIRTTDSRYPEIAADCGFPNSRSLRRSMLVFTGHTVDEIRKVSDQECHKMTEMMLQETEV